MTDAKIVQLEEALQGMERNLDGMLPLSFKFYSTRAGEILNEARNQKEYNPYLLRYDTLIKQAKERRII